MRSLPAPMLLLFGKGGTTHLEPNATKDAFEQTPAFTNFAKKVIEKVWVFVNQLTTSNRLVASEILGGKMRLSEQARKYRWEYRCPGFPRVFNSSSRLRKLNQA